MHVNYHRDESKTSAFRREHRHQSSFLKGKRSSYRSYKDVFKSKYRRAEAALLNKLSKNPTHDQTVNFQERVLWR